jgi:hypothetical protein
MELATHAARRPRVGCTWQQRRAAGSAIWHAKGQRWSWYVWRVQLGWWHGSTQSTGAHRRYTYTCTIQIIKMGREDRLCWQRRAEAWGGGRWPSTRLKIGRSEKDVCKALLLLLLQQQQRWLQSSTIDWSNSIPQLKRDRKSTGSELWVYDNKNSVFTLTHIHIHVHVHTIYIIYSSRPESELWQ